MSPQHQSERSSHGQRRVPLNSHSGARFSLHIPRVVLQWMGWCALCISIGIGWAYFTRPFSASLQLFAYEKTFATQAEAADFVANTTSTGALAKFVAKLPKSLATDSIGDRVRIALDQGQPISVSAIAQDEQSARTLADAFT